MLPVPHNNIPVICSPGRVQVASRHPQRARQFFQCNLIYGVILGRGGLLLAAGVEGPLFVQAGTRFQLSAISP